MPMLDADGRQVESGVARHAGALDTFELPDESIRSRLVPGCDARLIVTSEARDEVEVETLAHGYGRAGRSLRGLAQ